MTNHINEPEYVEHAEQIYLANHAISGLKSAAVQQETINNPLLFGEIYHYVCGHPGIDPHKIARGINNSVMARRQYNQLLRQLQTATGSVQAAASSDVVLDERQGDGFTLRLKTAKNHPGQWYVILTVNYPQPEQISNGVILHLQGDKLIGRLLFGSLVEGKAQQVIEQHSVEYLLITDINAQLTLI